MSIHLRPQFPTSCFFRPPNPARDLHRIRQCKPSVCLHFHTTHYLRDDLVSNPYDVLGVAPSATPAEIKKQFYDLSKTYHPDRNPTNQEEASRKFVAISDAYHIVGDPAKREKFDREHQRHRGEFSSPVPGASYTAGARKASGLSRRRTHFRGPPPSFYRNGAWGSMHGNRTPNSEADGRSSDAHGQEQQQQQYQQQQQTNHGGYYGTTGSWPFNTDPNDVPHFDREGHFRTTSSVEEQLRKGRNRRRRVFQEAEENMMHDDTPGDSLGRFFMVGAALVVGVAAPIFIFSGGPRGGIG